MPKRTDKDIIQAIRNSRGLIAAAARKLGVSRRTIYNRMEKSEDIREAVDEARDFTMDVAEAKLFQAIEAGESWAVQFYLKCQAKHRGYMERIQQDTNIRFPDGIPAARVDWGETEDDADG